MIRAQWRRSFADRPAAALALPGIVVLLVAFGEAFVMPQTAPRLETEAGPLAGASPLWSWAGALAVLVPDSRRGILLATLLLAATAFAAYGVGVAISRRRTALAAPGTVAPRRQVGIVVGVAVLAFGITAVALPTLDSDIFSYIADGRVAAVHDANPEVVAPAAFPDDPLVRYASPRYRGIAGDNKLPFWTAVTATLARAASDDPVRAVMTYRVFFLALNVLNLGLVGWILRRLRPDLVLAGLVAYGWNPIVISTGESKVDVLMATFVLLAVAAVAANRPRPAIVALALSALTKLISLPLLLVRLGGEARRRRWREALLDLGLVAAVAVAVYLPFWAGPAEIRGHLALLGGVGSSQPVAVRLLIDAGFLAVLGWAIASDDGSTERLIRGWTVTLLYFGALLTTPGLSWYLLTLIALLAVTADGRLVAAGIAVCGVSFLFDRVQRFELGEIVHLAGSVIFVTAGAAIIAALVTLVLGRHHRWAATV